MPDSEPVVMVVPPRWSRAAGRGAMFAAGLGALLGACCAGGAALAWQWLKRAAALP